MFMRIENALYSVMATGNNFIPYRLVKRTDPASSQWQELQKAEFPIQLYRHRAYTNRLYGYLKNQPMFFMEDAPSKIRRIDL